jgi:hypothetical protein
MSDEERLEQEERKDEDVEAHRKAMTDEPRTEEEGDDDVEAHRRKKV